MSEIFWRMKNHICFRIIIILIVLSFVHETIQCYNGHTVGIRNDINSSILKKQYLSLYYEQNDRYYYTFPSLAIVCNMYSTNNDFAIQFPLGALTEKFIMHLNSTPFLFGGLEKIVRLSDKFFDKNISYFEGGSFLGNITISKDYLYVDGFSLSMGTIYRSNNHKRKLIFDIDFGLKGFFPLNSKKTYDFNGEDVIFITKFEVKDSGERKAQKNAPVAMVPIICSIQYHKIIRNKSYLSFVIGFSYMFTGAGNYWYYENDVDNWVNGSSNKPTKIEGKPDYPVYQEIIPYISFGVKF